MVDFLEELKKKIINKINPEEISLKDNSYLHEKHKSFEKNKKVLRVKIGSLLMIISNCSLLVGHLCQ